VYQFNGQWFILGLLLVPAILFCPFIERPDVVPRKAMLTESSESGSGKRLYSSTIGKRNVMRSITAACLTQIGAQFTGINMIGKTQIFAFLYFICANVKYITLAQFARVGKTLVLKLGSKPNTSDGIDKP
jgi:hypothetical protein